jgi:hypothetical protein
MTASSAHAIANKTLREMLADHWEAFDNADRRIARLGTEISDAEGRRREAHALINSLTAQLKNLGPA